MKILVATEKPFAPAAVAGIKKAAEAEGHELVLLEKYTDKQQLLDAVKDADAMIVRSDKITKEVLDAAPNFEDRGACRCRLRLYRYGLCQGERRRGGEHAGQNSNAVAELVFGLLVYTVRNFFNGKAGSELKGKKLGILAFGNVGRNVARIAKGFDMEVYAFDEFVPADKIEAQGVHAAKDRDDLFKTCDIVSLHILATDETRKSINYEVVGQMKKGAILINTARKEVIDEDGLLKLLAEREDLKYITDIKPDKDAEFAKFEGRYFYAEEDGCTDG